MAPSAREAANCYGSAEPVPRRRIGSRDGRCRVLSAGHPSDDWRPPDASARGVRWGGRLRCAVRLTRWIVGLLVVARRMGSIVGIVHHERSQLARSAPSDHSLVLAHAANQEVTASHRQPMPDTPQDAGAGARGGRSGAGRPTRPEPAEPPHRKRRSAALARRDNARNSHCRRRSRCRGCDLWDAASQWADLSTRSP